MKKYSKFAVYKAQVFANFKNVGIIVGFVFLFLLAVLKVKSSGDTSIVIWVWVIAIALLLLGSLKSIFPKNYILFLDSKRIDLVGKQFTAGLIMKDLERYKKMLMDSKEQDTVLRADELVRSDILEHLQKHFQWAAEIVDPAQYLVLQNEINNIKSKKQTILDTHYEVEKNRDEEIEEINNQINILQVVIDSVDEEIGYIKTIIG